MQGQQAEFRCVAEGEPAPSIKWKLNGAEVQSDDSDRFCIDSSSDIVGTRLDRLTRLDSTFTILRTVAFDNGVVECEAVNMNSEQSFVAASSTTLTVSREFNHL